MLKLLEGFKKGDFDTFSGVVNKYVLLIELSFTRYDTI